MDRSAGRAEKESGQYGNRNDGNGAQWVRLQQSSVVVNAIILPAETAECGILRECEPLSKHLHERD
jgi:hypothetical protein